MRLIIALFSFFIAVTSSGLAMNTGPPMKKVSNELLVNTAEEQLVVNTSAIQFGLTRFGARDIVLSEDKTGMNGSIQINTMAIITTNAVPHVNTRIIGTPLAALQSQSTTSEKLVLSRKGQLYAGVGNYTERN